MYVDKDHKGVHENKNTYVKVEGLGMIWCPYFINSQRMDQDSRKGGYIPISPPIQNLMKYI